MQSTNTPEDMILAGLRKAGLPNIGIAALMGNWDVESGFRPNANNPNEGAIGFAQWEGGRRTALQNFASNLGLTETDPRAQIAFAIHELQTNYPSVWDKLKTANNVSDAAAYVDANYEISAGTTRQQRIQDANSIYSQLQSMKPGQGFSGNALNANGLVSIPVLPGLPGVPVPGSGGGIGDILTGALKPFTSVGTFFKDLVWIFNPSHFIRFMLYVLGFALIIGGLAMAIFGAGKDRPA